MADLASANASLALWEAAADALSHGRVFVMADGKRLELEAWPEVEKALVYCKKEVARLTRGGMRIRGGTPT
jgi:hypothetical protein